MPRWVRVDLDIDVDIDVGVVPGMWKGPLLGGGRVAPKHCPLSSPFLGLTSEPFSLRNAG